MNVNVNVRPQLCSAGFHVRVVEKQPEFVSACVLYRSYEHVFVSLYTQNSLLYTRLHTCCTCLSEVRNALTDAHSHMMRGCESIQTFGQCRTSANCREEPRTNHQNDYLMCVCACVVVCVCACMHTYMRARVCMSVCTRTG